ncbi:kinase domain protein (macronuclear) [Tetrahymena thermophila SB210]|uniref:Kinase domain protein n=1 Tax=Tetrahymena thermophila (strain SB210) TaxID=312017 RepID=A4VDL6_TETTS|nr:kinase domain protein [Tetrahymena thermophila SB210]EDK31615.2 kinase domain protein [Tetrahymena thermophila SB210]|eukprot:XP_001470847.2 kinase domain protein [Tetrahymena thermophila SB210]
MKEYFINSTILKLILDFIWIQVSFQDNINQIYSPKQLNQVNLTESWIPLCIVATSQSNLVFVSSGFDGIQVVDRFGSKIYLSFNISDSYISTFQVNQNGETLFLAVNQTLQVYSLSYSQINQELVKIEKLNMLQQLNFSQIILSTKYVEDLELLFVSGNQGLIIAYDTSNKSNITQVGSYNIQNTRVLDFFITRDSQFLFVSAYQKGLYILKLEITNSNQVNKVRQLNFVLSGQGNPGYQASRCLATQDFIVYCYDIWTGLYFANYQSLKQLGRSTTPITANFTLYQPQKQLVLTFSELIMNKEETLLFAGVRSYGIFVLDIKTRNQIKLFQQIGPYTEIQSIKLSSDQNFLYVTSVSSLFTFQQIQINSNDNYPNLFNMHQSNFYQLDNFLYRTCYIDPQDEYLFGAFDFEGMHVFPFYRNPYRLNVNNSKFYDVYTDQIKFDTSGRYAIVPQYYKGSILSIYQIRPLDNTPQQQQISPMNMKLIKSYPYDNSYFSQTFSFNLDRTMAVQPIQYGVTLYNSTDIFNLQIHSVWKMPDFILGDLNGACLTYDSKWVVALLYQIGFLVVNIEDRAAPKLANYYLNNGAEDILPSVYYNYVYLIDGTKGFAIIDSSVFPKINIISRIKLQGSAIYGLILQKEDYIIIAQNDLGMATLINMKDKYFPQIVSSANYLNEHAEGVCVCHTMNQIFLTTANGILTLPFKSEIKIHTAVYQIRQYSSSQLRKQAYPQASQKGTKTSPNLINEYIFLVGQTIELDFEIIYPTNLYMKITKVYFYTNEIQSDIPSFFSYNFQQQSLQMYIDQSLGSNDGTPKQNMVLIKTQIPLDVTSFIYSAEDSYDLAVTNSDQSAAIYNSMISQNILNSDGSVNDKFDFYKNLILNNELKIELINLSQKNEASLNETAIEQLAQKISLTLKKSYFLNPFKFYVVSSLQFNNKSTFQFIKTNSLKQVEVTLQINSNDGKLLQKNQDSVIFQISQSKDQLKITGTLESVNKVLQQKIIFANSTAFSEKDSPQITITIDDNTNFPLTLKQSIYESNFIILKNSIKLNDKLNLQYQLNNQYQGGIVYIESDVAISFSSNTFYVKDSKQITYQTFYLNPNGNFSLIPPNLWLQQMSSDKMNFKGTTTSAIYGKQYQFKVIATDGYTIAEDFFTVEVTGIPFTYALNLILKILGPVLAVFGIYKERFTFYNMIFRISVTFSDEEIVCGNPFKKRIIIISDEQEDAMVIFNNLIKNIIQKRPKGQQESDSERPSTSLKKKIYDIQKQIKTWNDKQSEFQEILKLEKKKKSNFESKLQHQYILKIQKELSIAGYQNNVSELQKRYLDKQGSLMLSQVIQDVVDFQIKPISYQSKSQDQYLEEISDPNSLLQRILRALMSRHLLKQDKRSQIIYEYIKNYCSQIIQQNKNDWFKAIVKITYNTDQELKNTEKITLFPQLKLNYSVLNEIIKSLNLTDQQNLQLIPQNLEQLKKLIDQHNLRFNMHLIREVIFADALGFPEEKPNRFKPSMGQCIHINFYEISQIIAYKQRKIFEFLRPIYRFFNMEYTKYGFSKNMRLPSWLYFDQKSNIILLHGTPQKCDIEEVLLKIYDKSGYVIYQFILKVVYQNQKQELKLFKRKIDQIYNETEEFQQQEESVHSKINEQNKLLSIRSPKISLIKNTYNQSETLEDSTQSIFKVRTQGNSPMLKASPENQCVLLETNIQDTKIEQICYTNFDDFQKILVCIPF